jgi:ABC-type amino acid transport substrate-binding protein
MSIAHWLAAFLGLMSMSASAGEAEKLRFCLLAAHQPFSLESNESGLEVAIARKLAEAMESQADFVWLASAGDFEEALAEGRCDLVPGALAEEGTLAGPPLAGVTLTRPYYAAGYQLVRRPETPAVSSIGGLPEVRIGVEGDSIVNFTLRQRQQPVQVMFDTDAVINTIASGELDYGYLWGPVAAWELRHRSDVLLDTKFRVEPRWHFAIGVRDDRVELWHRVDSALGEMLEHGVITEVFADHGVPYLSPRW